VDAASLQEPLGETKNKYSFESPSKGKAAHSPAGGEASGRKRERSPVRNIVKSIRKLSPLHKKHQASTASNTYNPQQKPPPKVTESISPISNTKLCCIGKRDGMDVEKELNSTQEDEK